MNTWILIVITSTYYSQVVTFQEFASWDACAKAARWVVQGENPENKSSRWRVAECFHKGGGAK